MNRGDLEVFASEAVKEIKSEKGFFDFLLILMKVTVEAFLNVELDEHLGYVRN